MIGMYTNISNETFNQMLLKAFNGNLEKLNHLINENDKITFIRHYTDLIDRYSYIKLQKSQWNWYYHIGITQNSWTIHIPKHIAEKNSICYTYGRSKHMIEQHRKQIQQQLSEIEKTIQVFEQKILSRFPQHMDYSLETKRGWWISISVIPMGEYECGAKFNEELSQNQRLEYH